jgi:hypothetical protein
MPVEPPESEQQAEVESPVPPDPLVATLLPVLMHELTNATQLLATMNTLLGIEGGEQLALSRTRDLARTSSRVDELGWMLAALASAAGADLLLERRERNGISILLAGVRETLRRRGCDLMLPEDPLPELDPNPASVLGPLGGWEIPWAVAALVVSSAQNLPRGKSLSLRLRIGAAGEPTRFSAPCGPPAETLARLVRLRLPGARLDIGTESWSLSIPDAWLNPSSAAQTAADGRSPRDP